MHEQAANVGCPRLLIPGIRSLPPELFCFGGNRSEADIWYPFDFMGIAIGGAHEQYSIGVMVGGAK